MIFYLKKAIIPSILFSMVLLSTFSVHAQDLISDSKTGKYLSVSEKQSRIYTEVAQFQSKNKVEKIQLLELHKNNEALLSQKSNFLDEAIYMTKDRTAMGNFMKKRPAKFSMAIPVNATNTIELVLIKQDIYTNDFYVTTERGEVDYDQSSIAHYKGYVKGNPNSFAAISITDDEIAGLIGDENGNYNLGSMSDDKAVMVLFNDRKVKKHVGVSCGNSHLQRQIGKETNPNVVGGEKSMTGACIEVSLTADFGIFELKGSSTTNAANYISTIFNQAKTIYENDGINIMLSETFVYTTLDPYHDAASADYVLDEFAFVTQDNFNGHIAHFMYTETYNRGGIANTSVLCQSYHTNYSDWDYDGILELHHYGPYGVEQILDDVESFPTYSWDVTTFAHELGHSLGAGHTQDCSWGPNNNQALDNCYETWDPWNQSDGNDCPAGPAPINGGTLMSYCTAGNYCPGLESECNNGTLDEFGNPIIGVSSNALYGVNLANGLGDFPGMINTPKSIILEEIANASCLSVCQEPPTQTCFDADILYDTNCESDYAPVCGCDNQTYYNICSAFYLNGITEYSVGTCQGEPDAGTSCPIINQASFEGGWGIWNDGGGNCFQQNAASVANSGTKSIFIRKYGRFNSDPLSLAGYNEVTLDFSLYARNMDNIWDRLFVRYSVNGGATWTTIDVVQYINDFQDRVHTPFSYTIEGPFTDQTVFRFMSATNSIYDIFNVDDVVISGCVNEGAGNSGVVDYLSAQTNAPCYDPANVNLDVDCIAYPMDMVCGCDGQTYYNTCFAWYSGLTNYVVGPCMQGKVTPNDNNNNTFQIPAISDASFEAPRIMVQYESNSNTVWFERSISGGEDNLNYQIFDFSGRLILNTSTTNNRWSMDSTDLPKGMYVINSVFGSEKFMIR